MNFPVKVGAYVTTALGVAVYDNYCDIKAFSKRTCFYPNKQEDLYNYSAVRLPLSFAYGALFPATLPLTVISKLIAKSCTP